MNVVTGISSVLLPQGPSNSKQSLEPAKSVCVCECVCVIRQLFFITGHVTHEFF